MSNTRRTLFAMAGVSAGIAATAFAPASAFASPASGPSPSTLDDLRAQIRAAAGEGVTTAALPTCTNHRRFVSGNWAANVPSTQAGNVNCQLELGDFNMAGVKVLQDGLNCNGENLTTDGDYGELTRNAVKRLQDKEGLQPTGVYTLPVFTNAPSWALYNTITDARACP